MPRLYNFQTNSYEEIPEELIREKVLSRQYAFTDSEKVPVIAPDGSRHLIPGTKALEAFGRGGNYGNTKDWARIARKEEYGEDSWENYLGASITGLARGATLGASDLVLRGILGKERMQTWREEFGGISTATEIGGAVLPAFFSGGLSTAGTGARLAARLPTSLAFRVGKAAEKALAGSALLARGANKGLALKVLSSSIPKGAGGALEGMAFGMGTSLSEMVLGDPDEASEMFLANLGMSALFGGLGAAGINAIGVGGAGMTAKTSDGIASLYEKATNSTLSVKAQKKFIDMSSDFMGVERETGRKQFGLYKDANEARTAALKTEKPFKAQQDGLVDGITDLMEDISQVAANSRGTNKQGEMRKLLFTADDAVDPTAQGEMVKAAIVKSRKVVAEMFVDLKTITDLPQRYSRLAGSNKLKGHAKTLYEVLKGEKGPRHFTGFDALENTLRKWDAPRPSNVTPNDDALLAALKEAGEDTYLLLDDYKKFLAHYAFGSKARNQLDFNVQGQLKDAWVRIHDLLEDEALWGAAAKAQRAVNPKFSRLIKAEKLFRKAFKDPVDNSLIGTKRVAKWVDELEGRGGDAMSSSWGREKDVVFNEFLDAAEDFAESSGSFYGFSTKEAVDGARATRDRVKTLVTDKRETRFINESVGGPGFNPRLAAQIFSRFGTAALGGVALGPVGAAAGMLLGGIADGASMARKLAHMEHYITKSRGAINKGLDDVVERMTKGGPGGTIPIRPNRTKLLLAPLAAQFGEDDAKGKTTRAEDYMAARERAKKLMDPQVLNTATGEVIKPIAYEMPNFSTAVQGKMANAMTHMFDGFSKDNRTADEVAMGVKARQPHDREIFQTEQRGAILEDPIGETVTNLKNGTLTGVQVDFLEKVYPNIYASFVGGILERVADLENPVIYAWRNTLGILLKRPLDVSQKPENITTLQASYGEKSEEGTKIKSTPLLKTHFGKGPTEVEKVMA